MKPNKHRATLILPALALTGSLCCSIQTASAVTTYNANITAIYGTGGNPDSGWVMDDLGISAGLRFHERFTTFAPNDGVGNYVFPLGTQVSFDWSANSGQSTLPELIWRMSGDIDPGPGTNFVNVRLELYPDNSYGTNATANAAGVEGTFASQAAGKTVMQNSGYVGWAPFGIDVNTPGTYSWKIQGTSPGDTQFANPFVSANATFTIVPEPSSAFLGLGVIGTMLTRRRRK